MKDASQNIEIISSESPDCGVQTTCSSGDLIMIRVDGITVIGLDLAARKVGQWIGPGGESEWVALATFPETDPLA